MASQKKIACIGAGYVGGPTMAVIAQKCPQCTVTVVDINQKRINDWNSDTLPFYEPGLDDIVNTVRGKNLFFSTEVEKAIIENDIIFIAVNTPTKDYGVGKNMAADLQHWETIARQIRNVARSNKIIIEKSTLPVKTAEAMEIILNTGSQFHFEVMSNPEFLAEGTAVNNLLSPDRVLIGSRETESGQKARNELVEIYKSWVPLEKIITTNTFSAELTKLVSNAFLAQRVSSINAVSAICEATGADVDEVSKAVGADSRIGAKFLKASVGFGGSCFRKDILNLVYICRMYHLHEIATYFENIINMNSFQQQRFVDNIVQSMFNTVAGRKICMLGCAFKACTDDVRDSPALSVATTLIAEKANLVISDPKAMTNMKAALGDLKNVEFIDDPYQAAKKCHAIVIITEWDVYATLDYKKLFDRMVKPAYLFDGRNMVNRKTCYDIGFNVYSIGKEPLIH
ncbi:MAG: nucleotide sugar dehydrogenase [Candidatus Magnetomorum sp.]|nr:nucleotide sugar dehydrogenase [Candidatus Magnetomorum sp.]